MLSVTLEDKYKRESGRVFLTGVQALTLPDRKSVV